MKLLLVLSLLGKAEISCCLSFLVWSRPGPVLPEKDCPLQILYILLCRQDSRYQSGMFKMLGAQTL